MPALGHLITLECRTAQYLDAAKNNDVECVQRILDDAILSVNTVQWTPRRLSQGLGKHWPAWGAQPGATALHCAADAGSAEVVSALIARGANPDETTRYGVSALHLACYGGHSAVVSLLIAAAVDVRRVCTDMFDVAGPSALHLACCCENATAGKLCVTLLLRAGADPRQVCRSTGRTPLHYAASISNAGACRLLVQAGAWVQAADLAQATPLSLARAHLSCPPPLTLTTPNPNLTLTLTLPAPRAIGTREALSTMRELRWTPAVRLLWLGQVRSSSGTAAPCGASCDDATAAGEVTAQEPRAGQLIQCLTRDVVRLIADAIVDSHTPPQAEAGADRPTADGTADEEQLSLAELSQAVRLLHDSPPAHAERHAHGAEAHVDVFDIGDAVEDDR